MKNENSYHHGNARSALINAGLLLLNTTPANQLSLRMVADAAGLSRQAPYNHFKDKEELLAAIAECGFQKLAKSMLQAKSSSLGAKEALADLGEAYIQFAHESRQLFRLMFSSELTDLEQFPSALSASDATYDILKSVIRKLVEPELLEERALAAWSLVHGYATLCIEMNLENATQAKARAKQFASLLVF